jgi:hypothetical protein
MEQWMMLEFKDNYGVLQLNASAVDQHRKSQNTFITWLFPIHWDKPFIGDPHDHLYQEFWSMNSEQALEHNPIAKRPLQ